jgi:hypothetical protein
MTTRADGSLRETYGRYSQHVDGAGGSGAYGFGESKAEDSHSTQPQPHATSSQFVVRPSSTADIYSLTRTQPVNYSSPKPPRAVQPHAAGAEVPGGRGGPTAASSVPASASSSSSSSLSSGPQHRHQVPSHGHQPQHHQQSRVSGPGATDPVRSAVDISDEEIARDPMFVEILSHALRGDAVGQSSQSTVAGAAGSTAADIQENDRIASLAQSIRNTLLASPSAVVGAATRRAHEALRRGEGHGSDSDVSDDEGPSHSGELFLPRSSYFKSKSSVASSAHVAETSSSTTTSPESSEGGGGGRGNRVGGGHRDVRGADLSSDDEDESDKAYRGATSRGVSTAARSGLSDSVIRGKQRAAAASAGAGTGLGSFLGASSSSGGTGTGIGSKAGDTRAASSSLGMGSGSSGGAASANIYVPRSSPAGRAPAFAHHGVSTGSHGLSAQDTNASTYESARQSLRSIHEKLTRKPKL